MKNNKGITLTALVIYITVMFVVLALLMRITMNFSNNIGEAANTTFETQFQKINLYLLEESRKTGNEIQSISEDGTSIIFSSGNIYAFNKAENNIYLNSSIKICEKIADCEFNRKIAENGKTVLELYVEIAGIEKTVNYVMTSTEAEQHISISDFYVNTSVKPKVGDYVNYVPDTGTYSVVNGSEGSGYTQVQTFTTESGENSLNWRIWSTDNEKIELVAEKASSKTIVFRNVAGYNHGVDILNDLCETLYSKSINDKKVAKARNITVDDILKKTTYDYTRYNNYGVIKSLSDYTTGRKYPEICKIANGYYVDGEEQTGGISDSTGIKDGVIENGVTKYKTITKFVDDNVENKNISMLLRQINFKCEDYLKDESTPRGLISNGEQYWLATRSLYNTGSNISFGLRVVSEGRRYVSSRRILDNRIWK